MNTYAVVTQSGVMSGASQALGIGQGAMLALWVALSLAGWFLLLHAEELMARSWKQRIASVGLLIVIVMLLGSSAKAVYIEDDKTYYCMAWGWWPWSGC